MPTTPAAPMGEDEDGDRAVEGNPWVEGKSKEELVADMFATSASTALDESTIVFRQLAAGLAMRCTKDVEKALAGHAAAVGDSIRAANRLSWGVVVLDVVLVAATVLGVFVAYMEYVRGGA